MSEHTTFLITVYSEDSEHWVIFFDTLLPFSNKSFSYFPLTFLTVFFSLSYNLKTRSGELLIKPRTLTVENAEQVHPVAGTKYQTYAASSRLLYADGNVQTPLYANAAFVLKPGKPVLYVGITTDVQRDYFKPIFDNAFKSIK